jgi:anti-sigma28 factor (negative regulator of flagellin synthesis)
MKRTVQSLRAKHSPYPLKTYARRRSAVLTGRRAALRAKRVQRIKEQIDRGTYEVSAADLTRGIARSELFWLL